ncbi:hypothetical protein DL240_14625 [Lujinxingia litoralis]|uniref:Thiaminase-2/PQQC domain-containing protein n=1 Tax=Lujinxingia litoralis TaxID=2211119 RepID=A0A328C4V7_9DELT|nr:hypothetical protein [Lujinxingia litoralis]RAL20910.1 hypothetical protein DL240_14625 [Lujinxingia litoralis]
MSLASRLRRENDALFEAARAHPFVRGIGDGSLPREVFGRWITQDWLYLQGYVVALDAASQLALTESSRHFWGELARLTREVELELHRGLARRFGLPINALDEAAPFGATTSYLATLKAARSSYPTLVATLTPCAVGYAEIARDLDSQNAHRPADYDAWIATYTDAAFQQSVPIFEAELNRCTAIEGAMMTIEGAYKDAARCELEFWEGLWQGR